MERGKQKEREREVGLLKFVSVAIPQMAARRNRGGTLPGFRHLTHSGYIHEINAAPGHGSPRKKRDPSPPSRKEGKGRQGKYSEFCYYYYYYC